MRFLLTLARCIFAAPKQPIGWAEVGASSDLCNRRLTAAADWRGRSRPIEQSRGRAQTLNYSLGHRSLTLIAARGRVATRRTSSPPPRCCSAPTFPWAVLWRLRMPRIIGKIPRIDLRGETGLCVTKEGWRLIEERYGRRLPDEARDAVTAVTNKYMQLASAEENASSKEDALNRLRNLKDRTVFLHAAINELPVDNPVRQYVDEEIAFAYTVSQYENATTILEYVSFFERDLERFSKACDDTINFLSKHNFWPAGGAWDVWIRQLTTVLGGYHLPTPARKDSDNKGDRTSPFVEFVDAFQRLIIPEQFRRSLHSKGALATAIHKARSYSKPLTSEKDGSG
jgi:hypothetical protein